MRRAIAVLGALVPAGGESDSAKLNGLEGQPVLSSVIVQAYEREADSLDRVMQQLSPVEKPHDRLRYESTSRALDEVREKLAGQELIFGRSSAKNEKLMR